MFDLPQSADIYIVARPHILLQYAYCLRGVLFSRQDKSPIKRPPVLIQTILGETQLLPQVGYRSHSDQSF